MPRPPTTTRPNQPFKRCRYCHGRFKARGSGGKEQQFCSPQHRKNFHRYGSLPFDKLMARIDKSVRNLVPLLVKAEMDRYLPSKHND